MAYDANILNEEEKTEGMSVLGAQGQAPLQPQGDVSQAAQLDGPSQSSVIQAGATGTPSKASKTPSSGMFTNIKKYIGANRPQAGRMAGEVAKGLGTEAEKVNTAVQQSQQAYQQRADTAKQQQTTQQQASQDILNRAAQTGDIKGADVGQFTQYQSGGTRYDQIGDIDLTQAQARMKDVEGLTESGKSEKGRRDLLMRTFGRGDRGYSSGQQSLDQLLLQGTPEGFGGLMSGLEAKRKEAATGISGAQAGAQTQRAALAQSRKDILAGLQQQLTGETGKVNESIQQRLTDLQAQQQSYKDVLAGGGATYDQFNQMVSPEERAEIIADARQAQQNIAGVGDLDKFAQSYGQGGWLTQNVLNERERRDKEQTELDLYKRLTTGQPEEVSGIMSQTAEGGQAGIQSMTDPSTGKAYNVLQDEGKLLVLPDDYAGQEIIEDSNGQKGYMTTKPHPYYPSNRIQAFEPLTETISGEATGSKFIRGEHAGMLRQELLRATQNISNQDLSALGLDRSDLNSALERQIAAQGGSGVDPLEAAKAIRDLAGQADISDDAVMKRFYDRFSTSVAPGSDQALLDQIGGTFSAPELNTQSVATSQEAARLRALQQLSGITPTIDPSQAGTATIPGTLDASSIRQQLLRQIAGGPKSDNSKWVSAGGL